MVCMVSWYQIIHSEEYKEFMKKKQDTEQDDIDDGNKKIYSSEYVKILFLQIHPHHLSMHHQ